MNLNNVVPYNVVQTDVDTPVKVAIIDKTVNRDYTCEVDESGTTHFYPAGFSLSPAPNYEKIQWGAPERIDGTSDGPLDDVYNSEDYEAYVGRNNIIDDNNIILGNIKGAQTLRRKPFYVNGYYDGKSATNVILSAEISSVGISGNSYYYFDVTNLDGDYANTEAFSIKFPNGYVANCSRREEVDPSTTRLFCYSFGDDYTAEIIDRSNSGDTVATGYIKRASIFPSISYTTYVAPFYGEVNFIYVDNTLDRFKDVTSSITRDVIGNYLLVTVVFRNEVGADIYKFNYNYNKTNGSTTVSSSFTITVSGNTKSSTIRLDSSVVGAGWTVDPNSVVMSTFKINEITYNASEFNNPKTYSNGNKAYYAYGKANGGITYGGYHSLIIDNSQIFNVPASDENIHLPNNTSYSGTTNGIKDSFSYKIFEGFSISVQGVQTLSIEDSVSFFEFPELSYDGTKVYSNGSENVRFYVIMRKCFKLDEHGYPVIDESLFPFNNRVPQNLSELGGTDITNAITTNTGYIYTPRQDDFIVGVYTNYDQNDTREGDNRRPLTRVIKLYRNYEIKYIE